MHSREALERERWHERRLCLISRHHERMLRATLSTMPTANACPDRLQILPENRILRTAAIHRLRLPPINPLPRISRMRRPTPPRKAQHSLYPRRPLQHRIYLTPSLIFTPLYNTPNPPPRPSQRHNLHPLPRDHRLERADTAAAQQK
jgi:hypothetical protein